MPLHHISRGGGLAFHYPEQLVFYPILSLEKHKIRIFDLLLYTIKQFKDALEELYQLNELDCERDLIGLWHGPYKLASIGVSARRFVSYHGLALNLKRDERLARTLAKAFPCGLSGATYTYLEDLTDITLAGDEFSAIQNYVLQHLLEL